MNSKSLVAFSNRAMAHLKASTAATHYVHLPRSICGSTVTKFVCIAFLPAACSVPCPNNLATYVPCALKFLSSVVLLSEDVFKVVNDSAGTC